MLILQVIVNVNINSKIVNVNNINIKQKSCVYAPG